MSSLTRIATCTCVLVSFAASAASARPTSTPVPDIPKSYLFTPEGKATPLRARVTYQASQFPLALRLTPPEGGWSGAQWKSGTEYFRGGGPPNFGWVHLARGSAAGRPRPWCCTTPKM